MMMMAKQSSTLSETPKVITKARRWKPDKRRRGYSRDHRGDCVQVIIALVVTPEGLPLAHEVLPLRAAAWRTIQRGE
jgi:hypothetical protein